MFSAVLLLEPLGPSWVVLDPCDISVVRQFISWSLRGGLLALVVWLVLLSLVAGLWSSCARCVVKCSDVTYVLGSPLSRTDGSLVVFVLVYGLSCAHWLFVVVSWLSSSVGSVQICCIGGVWCPVYWVQAFQFSSHLLLSGGLVVASHFLVRGDLTNFWSFPALLVGFWPSCFRPICC